MKPTKLAFTIVLLLGNALVILPMANATNLKNILKDIVNEQMNPKAQPETAPGVVSGTNQVEPAAVPTNTTTPTTSPVTLQVLPDAVISIATEAKSSLNLKNPNNEEEVAIGRELAGNLLGAAPLVKNEALQKYVNNVGRWVASQSDRPDLRWHFGIIDSEDLNAFAAPGGYVLITKGLYRKLENEAQLAGVLGHEIGHVVKKHHLKVIQKQQLISAGADFLNQTFGKKDKIVASVIGQGAEISARSLDKSAEYEADRIGTMLAARAGYEPFGLAEVLQTIGQTNQNDSSVALLYKTHPSPDERLNKLSDAVGDKLDTIKDGKTLKERLVKIKNNLN